AMPRHEAAVLGDPVGAAEALLFLDLGQEESRRVAREALELLPDLRARGVRIVVYAGGEDGAALVAAQRAGRAADGLRSLLERKRATADPSAALVVARQERARAQLGIDAYPTALWRDGRKTGAFSLREIADAVR
ncbi:MAG: hypothetical protein ACREID_05760, partial [Planctomycetota bacterium]